MLISTEVSSCGLVRGSKRHSLDPLANPQHDDVGMTASLLYSADMTLPMPFTVALADTDQLLICEKIIRLVPYKRLVVFAKWGNRDVVAKLFFHPKKATDSFTRDVRGVNALAKAHILSPKLLYHGHVVDQPDLYVFILEKIEHAQTVADIWHARKNDEAVLPLMQAVTREIANHHTRGILQRDIHLKNFIVAHNKIYSIDGSKISIHPQAVPKKLSLKNFATFLIQLGAGSKNVRRELFKVYMQARHWKMNWYNTYQLNKYAQHIHLDLSSRYLKKIFRDCSLFKKGYAAQSSYMYTREYYSAEFNHFLNNPEAFLQKPDTIIFQTKHDSMVAKVRIDDKWLVVKKYQDLKARESKAARAWRLAQRLTTQGIRVPKPVAFIESNRKTTPRTSYYLMEYVEGLPPHPEDRKTITNVVKNLGELNIALRDTQDFLIVDELPMLMNLDALREYRLAFFINFKFMQK